MSFYRTLNWNGEKYQFHIGKKNTKIKFPDGTSKVVPNRDIGADLRYDDKYVVTPKMIVDYLSGVGYQGDQVYFPTCSCENVPKKLRCKPFDAEIYDKSIYVVWCDECYDENYNEI